jgi:phosphoglycerate kinase
MANDCIGEEVEKLAAAYRFYKEKEKNDAFGTTHMAHASTKGVTKFLRPSASSCRRYS